MYTFETSGTATQTFRGEAMKRPGKIMPQQYREVCRAVCAIVNVNINENRYFQQSGVKNRVSRLRRNSFTDNGVVVEIDKGYVKIRVYVNAMIGEYSILFNAIELQKNIEEEMILLTSISPKGIDIIINQLNAKKTQ